MSPVRNPVFTGFRLCALAKHSLLTLIFRCYTKYIRQQKDMANTHPLTTAELTHYTNLWCRERGIHAKDLTSHPHADDVVLMLRWREEMWPKLNKSEQAVWGAYWNTVYHKRRPIHKKALNKLEQITITASDRHLEDSKLLATQRQRIQALKQNPYSKSSDDIVAKTDDSTYSVPWE